MPYCVTCQGGSCALFPGSFLLFISVFHYGPVSHNIWSAQFKGPAGPNIIKEKVRPLSIIKGPALGFVFNFKMFNLSIVLLNSIYAHTYKLVDGNRNLP